MLKILVLDELRRNEGVWFYPEDIENLIYDWKRFRFPFMNPFSSVPEKYRGKFIWYSLVFGALYGQARLAHFIKFITFGNRFLRVSSLTRWR